MAKSCGRLLELPPLFPKAHFKAGDHAQIAIDDKGNITFASGNRGFDVTTLGRTTHDTSTNIRSGLKSDTTNRNESGNINQHYDREGKQNPVILYSNYNPITGAQEYTKLIAKGGYERNGTTLDIKNAHVDGHPELSFDIKTQIGNLNPENAIQQSRLKQQAILFENPQTTLLDSSTNVPGGVNIENSQTAMQKLEEMQQGFIPGVPNSRYQKADTMATFLFDNPERARAFALNLSQKTFGDAFSLKEEGSTQHSFTEKNSAGGKLDWKFKKSLIGRLVNELTGAGLSAYVGMEVSNTNMKSSSDSISRNVMTQTIMNIATAKDLTHKQKVELMSKAVQIGKEVLKGNASSIPIIGESSADLNDSVRDLYNNRYMPQSSKPDSEPNDVYLD